jgi:hypothetical protein
VASMINTFYFTRMFFSSEFNEYLSVEGKLYLRFRLQSETQWRPDMWDPQHAMSANTVLYRCQ